MVANNAVVPTVSLVIPVYNEIEVLPLLFQRLRAVMEKVNESYEIVLVDDGSQDGSRDYMVEASMSSGDIRTVLLSRNFGKEAALSAGLRQARGDATIILDADLQDPPELIPDMLAAWRDGADVVSMKRRQREGETWFKKLSAHAFYRILNKLTSGMTIPSDTGDFRLMSRRSLNALNKLPERNRYMKGLFAWVGYPTHVMLYDRDARAAGNTSWNFLSLFGLAFEGITSFSIMPLRVMVVLGIFAAALGGIFGAWIVLRTMMFGSDLAGYPSLIAVITFMGGLQLVSIGVVGEYVGKTYFEAKQRPLYIIQEVVEKSASDKSESVEAQ